jgi:hypothetical protein
VQESARDLQTPLHPAGEVLDRRLRSHSSKIFRAVRSAGARRARHAAQDAVELHVFACQFLVEADPETHAEAPPHFGRLRDRVQAVDFDVPLVGVSSVVNILIVVTLSAVGAEERRSP